MTSTGTKTQKYPGTCDIDLSVLIAERLADGDSPVTEAYEVPADCALTEAELADLLAERVITEAEAIAAGHPHVWALASGEEYGELSTRLYAERDLARDDFAAMAAELLDRWSAEAFDTITAAADGTLFLQLHCDLIRLDAQLVTTQAQVTPRDSHSIDIAWTAIETAAPALPR